MASSYTANYGLCQWAPENAFLREEFNKDNAKIDAALKAAEERAEEKASAAEDKADRALSGLEDQSYNVYNLILQNDYEGKYTGYKKALLYDGFLDDMDRELSTSVLLCGGSLVLGQVGQGNVNYPYGSQSTRTSGVTESKTAEGNGYVTGFTFQVYTDVSMSGTEYMPYRLSRNGEDVLTGQYALSGLSRDQTKEFKITFPKAVGLRKGDVFTFTLEAPSTHFWITGGDRSGSLAGTLYVTPVSGSSGTVSQTQPSLPACDGLRAWVRHQGGSVSLTVQRESDEPQSLTLGGQKSAAEPLNGKVCMESSFRLDRGLAEGQFRITLAVTLGGSEQEMDVFDYGILWI